MPNTGDTITNDWFYYASREGNFSTMHIWDGDGDPNRVFEINFEGGYLSTSHVKSFKVHNKTRQRVDLGVIWIGPNTVKLSEAVPPGWQVVIFRDTPKNQPLAVYSDGAVLVADNLDRNAKQAVFAVSEMIDRFDGVTSSSEEALKVAYSTIDAATNAVRTANAADSKADAATSTANAANSKADAATATANDASTTAHGIDAKAQTALDNSTAAVGTANTASAVAYGIDAKATTAQSNSQTAVDVAESAKSVAAAAQNTANGIATTANTALDNSKEAVNTSNTASTTAAAAHMGANLALSKLADLKDGAYMRSSTAGWNNLAGAQDEITNTQQFVGLRNSILPETGGNSNGFYRKHPDGTIECWHNNLIKPSGTSQATWKYPHPIIFGTEAVTLTERYESEWRTRAWLINPIENGVQVNPYFQEYKPENAPRLAVQIRVIGRWK